MSAKHTQGDWKIVQGLDGNLIVVDDPERDKMILVAKVAYNAFRAAECEANTQLLLAAPAMKEALERAANELDNHCGGTCIAQAKCPACDVAEEARAALALAEGEVTP